MNKTLLLLLIFFSSVSFAESSTKSDIKELSLQMRENNKLLIELIKSEIKANRDLIKANQEATNKRFEDMQKSVDKRFEEMNNKFYLIMALSLLILGYLIKERGSIKVEIKKELEPELIKKADKHMLDKVIAVIEDMAMKDDEVKKLLSKHRLQLNS